MNLLAKPQPADINLAVINPSSPVAGVPVRRLMSGRSLLRYPGGKTRAVAIITKYFPPDITEMCSPFLGGGSIELHYACKGAKVYGYDIFKPLVEFWQCAISDASKLADCVHKHYPLTRDKFYELQQRQTRFKPKLERAAVFYVLNRSSFSGSTLSGGMSPLHPRFTQSSIDRLRQFYNPNLEVRQADFKESIAAHKNVFTYLDPPYLIGNTLYGTKGDTHRDFDHAGLAKILRKRDNWIMSYNDCKEIRALYADYTIIRPEWKYGMSTDKSSREVLIFSRGLTPDMHAEPKKKRERV
jgi:DNA adenine methylase